MFLQLSLYVSHVVLIMRLSVYWQLALGVIYQAYVPLTKKRKTNDIKNVACEQALLSSSFLRAARRWSGHLQAGLLHSYLFHPMVFSFVQEEKKWKLQKHQRKLTLHFSHPIPSPRACRRVSRTKQRSRTRCQGNKSNGLVQTWFYWLWNLRNFVAKARKEWPGRRQL